MARLHRFTFPLIFILVLLVTVGFVPWHAVRAASTFTVNTTADKVTSLTCGTWSVVPSPNVGSSTNVFQGVAAVSASDVWAVGDFVNSSGNDQTLTEHWNGHKWKVVPSPNV